MEDSEIHSLVKTTVREAVKISHSELLRDIGSMIQQISSPASSSLNSSTYHSVLDAPKFKRRSNVEQFKQNSKVMAKLDLAESHIEKQNIADAKESIIEARECSDIQFSGKVSGIYTIYPNGNSGHPRDVYCYFADGHVWTVFQRRFNGSVNFYRNWDSYKNGFGDADGEYWLGNDALHSLSSNGPHSLRVELTNDNYRTKYALYQVFNVMDESNGYRLSVSGYTGNAPDCLSGRWNSMMFSTYDRDNDQDDRNCAVLYHGAWWYEACHCGNLNGPYLAGHHNSEGDGIDWDNMHYSYRQTMMMLRKL